MPISRFIPCALDSRRFRVLLRDLSRRINYDSPRGEIAFLPTPEELTVTRGWIGFPPWVHHARLGVVNGEVKLDLEIEAGRRPEEKEGLADLVVSDLSEYFSFPVKPFRTRVFGLGWSKSGTTSLTLAMRRLGFFSWRLAPWTIGLPHALAGKPDIPPDMSAVAEYDFFADLPISLFYRELDENYPGSLFILTTRPVDAWLPLGQAAIEKDLASFGALPTLARWAYGTSAIDGKVLRERYSRHQAEVLAYFAGRPDFLAIDLNDGDPWPKLCGFLGIPVPDTAMDIAFPWRGTRVAL